MSKIMEDMIRETAEQAEREALLEVLKSGRHSIADIAYADDMPENISLTPVHICSQFPVN